MTSYIRNATIEDVPLINSLAHRIWPTAYKDILTQAQLVYMLNLIYNPEKLKEQMLLLKHQFLIIEQDREPLGFASFGQTENPSVYKLHKLYVLPDQQKKGLGKHLLETVMKYVKRFSATSIILNVNRNNEAVRFYERSGFKIIGIDDINIGNNYFMNDYIMSYNI